MLHQFYGSLIMWYAKNSASSGQGIVIDEQTGRSVAVAYDEKDTALLAAAPELLAALQECKRLLAVVWEYDGDVFGVHHNSAVDAENLIDAAINKATQP
jgi:hypothetical protein